MDTKYLSQALQLATEEIGPVGEAESITSLEGWNKISQLEERTEVFSSPDFINLLVAEAGDMRVILLRICLCVAEMRGLGSEGDDIEAYRRSVSQLAALVYAPLAHKLGLYNLKRELEDLSLKYLEHEAYYHIKEKLAATKKSRDEYVENFCKPIHEMMQSAGIKYHIKGRTKSIHSIWQKMKRQKCPFEGVYDLFAIRIIIDAPEKLEKDLCWQAFSLITNKYESSLKRLRDWLTVPKPNGYESLHITVLGPQDKWVEVQIRTERMDEIAEHGLAAHWRYKGVKAQGGGIESWLADVRSALEQGQPLPETSTKSKTQAIYVFSPKGDLIKLPAQATVLDYAYHIHSHIGNRCVGGIVNGKKVPIRQVLESGQTVEIQTSNSQQPKNDWLQIVVSPHSKSKIRQSIRDIQYRDVGLARELLERRLKNRKIEWNETLINQLIKKLNYKEASDFFLDLHAEKLDLNDILDTYIQLQKRELGTAERAAVKSADTFSDEAITQQSSDTIVLDSNLKGLDFQFAPCCNPVFGDDVFGFVTVSGGIKIHRHSCPNAAMLKERFPYRILPVKWAGQTKDSQAVTLRVIGHDDIGIVNNITSIISKEEHIMLRSISIESHDGLFSGILSVMINDVSKLQTLVRKLKTVKGVKDVGRM